MSQPGTPNQIVLAIKGLVLNPSTFDTQVPDGSLTVANNVVIDRPSVVATRRGFSNYWSSKNDFGQSNEPTAMLYPAYSMFQYNGNIIKHCNTPSTGGPGLVKILYQPGSNIPYEEYFNDGEGNYYEFYVPDRFDTESRIRAVELNKNFYFITDAGTFRLDNIDNTPRLAGAPAGLGGSAETTGTSGFMPDTTSVAYRVVFGYKDSNNQLVLGAPSGRILVSNTSGTPADVEVTFQVPKEIRLNPSNFFFQVYRGHTSPNLLTEPDDELGLVYEDACDTALTPIDPDGNITITDSTPPNLVGAFLYTNQSQDGILQSNFRPPWAKDICTFKQYTFYANTKTLPTANLTLISAGASNGADALVPDDTITFTPVFPFGMVPFTLTASTVNDPALGLFAVSNTGNPAYDIQVTATNIVNIANAYIGNEIIAAYYTSGTTDLPGKMRFDNLSQTSIPKYPLTIPIMPEPTGEFTGFDIQFKITSSRSTCWEQILTDDTSTTSLISTNDEKPNRIYYSKFSQPEAVPLVNYIDVGSANAPIRRVVPLRDGVMVLKDDGVFRVSNAAPPFTVTPIDYNVRILAANTADALDNKVYFLSDQGIVALSDSDTQIMSFLLDKTIIENTSPDLFPDLRGVAWGIAYQSDRKYILTMPAQNGTKQYVYNHLTQVWTNWTIFSNCGIVFKRDGKLYLNGTLQERKSFTNNDYADLQLPEQIISVLSPTEIVMTSTNVKSTYQNTLLYDLVGWTIREDSFGINATIIEASINEDGNLLIKVDIPQPFIPGGAYFWLYEPIKCEVQTIQLDCNNPALNKQFSEIVYVFTEQGFEKLEVAMYSNTSIVPVQDTLVPVTNSGWGYDAWGFVWGGGTRGQGKIRRYVPQAIQRAGWLYVNITHYEAFSNFGWSGFQLFYKATSTRQF